MLCPQGSVKEEAKTATASLMRRKVFEMIATYQADRYAVRTDCVYFENVNNFERADRGY